MRKVSTALFTIFVIVACSSRPAYVPAKTKGDIGYFEQSITDSQFRVTYTGGRTVSRHEAKNYALLRAAELTVEQGYDWFKILQSESATQENKRPVTINAAQRTVEQRCSLISCTTYTGPYFDQIQVASVNDESHSASLLIAMGKGEVKADADNNVDKLDASQVMANLRPQVE